MLTLPYATSDLEVEQSSQERTLRLVHLSDFHFRASKTQDQDIIVGAFLSDLAKMQSEAPIDLVLFSGDLAFSGRPEEYHLAEQYLLKPILEVACIDRGRLVLSPGNHDVDRTQIEKYEEAGLLATLTARDPVNELLDEGKELLPRLRRLSAWNKFNTEFYANVPERTEHFSGLLNIFTYEIDAKSVVVASLSSAWRSSGDEDQGRLIVGDRVAKSASSAASAAALRIGVIHHPLSWLSDFDALDVERELLREFDILCSGHTHAAAPVAVMAPAGGYITSAAGSLYGERGRDFSNGYTVLDVDFVSQELTMRLREYQPSREQFDAAVSVAEAGTLTVPLPTPSRSVGSAARRVSNRDPDSMQLRAALHLLELAREKSVLGTITGDSGGATGPFRQLSEFIVEPTLHVLPRSGERTASTLADEAVTTEALVEMASKSRVLLFGGDAGAGLTTVLTWVALLLADRWPSRIPIQVPSEVGPGPRAVLQSVRAALAAAQVDVEAGDEVPPLIMAVDDVHLLSDKKLRRLATFCSDHPDSIFLLGCRADDLSRLSTSFGEELESLALYVGRIRHGKLRSLVRTVAPGHDEEILRLVSDLAGGNDVGRTPFVLTALVRVAAAGEGVQATADAVDITRIYANFLLGTDDRFASSRVEITSSNRENILSRLAEKMVRDGDSGTIERHELEGFLLQYFEAVDWSAPVSHVVDDFVTRWILFEIRPNQFAFRQRSMFAFFAAVRASRDPEFKQWLLDDAVRWSYALEYAAGLSRDDLALLKAVSLLLPERPSRRGGFSRQGETRHASAEMFEANEESEPPEIAETRDSGGEVGVTEELDQLFDLMAIGSGAVQLGLPADVYHPALKYGEMVRLASVVLRYSESVADAGLKHSLLKELVIRWADVADWLLAVAPPAIREAIATEGLEDKLEEGLGGATLDDAVESLVIIMALTSAVERLSSVKLDRALKALLEDEDLHNADPGAALFVIALAADGEMRGWEATAEAVVKRHGRIGAVRAGILHLASAAVRPADGRRKPDAAVRLLAEAAVAGWSWPSEAQRKAQKEAIIRQFTSPQGRRQ